MACDMLFRVKGVWTLISALVQAGNSWLRRSLYIFHSIASVSDALACGSSLCSWRDPPQAIAALREKASGAYDDNGITTSVGGAIIASGDANSITYSRTPNQVQRPDTIQLGLHNTSRLSMRRAPQHGSVAQEGVLRALPDDRGAAPGVDQSWRHQRPDL